MARFWTPLFIMVIVMVGCCGSVFFLEKMVKQDSGSVNVLTFLSFLFVACEGFVVTTRFGRLKSHVPMSAYVYLVVLYFIVSVINNLALNFNVSMPLHMIFKGGGLIASMLTGMYYFGRRYTILKYLAVMMITVGIIISTIESGKDVKCCDEKKTTASVSSYLSWIEPTTEWGRWMTGVSMMTIALFLGARMGVFQEQIFRQYGNYPKEALYYTHLLPLPGFILMSANIYEHLTLALESEPLSVNIWGSEFDLLLPSSIAYITGYVVMQYICILSVFLLTAECTNLTVTLVLTLRKFLSLLFSVYYFSNPFTWKLALGSVLVFGGTLLFSDVPKLLWEKLFSTKTVKTE